VHNVPAVVYLREAASGKLHFLSPAVAELAGRPASDFLSGAADLADLRHPDDTASVAAQVEAALAEGRAFQVVYRLRGASPQRWVEERGHAVAGEDGTPRFLEGSLVDVTERRRFEEQLLHQALHDPLTALPNRALLLDRLRVAIRRVQRPQAEKFAVLQVDLDRFKVINDSLGHGRGDRLLQALAGRLQACVRPGDTVARLGGDEFAVLLEDLDDPADALRVAERMRAELQVPFVVEGHELYSAASVGVVMGDARYHEPEELLRDADTALHQAKAAGRGRHVVFDPDMHRRALARLALESELRRALEREELELHFQPIVALDDGTVVGVEALLRWRHPERGLLGPDHFLDVAAESGQLPNIGAWVLRQACAQLRKWVSLAPDLLLHVNLHPVELTQPGLAERVAETVRAAELAPGRLQLELTEHLVMSGPEETIRLLEQLRDVGVGLCLDDFGTGYSSLAALHRFPISALKLDRSFVARLGREEGGAAIVRTVGALGRVLHLAAIAEGIEEPSQLVLLRELGYRYGQGYHFARPMPADAMTQLLAKGA
jgi:diguanylate cyclase (GGDEF)-like protein